MHNISGGLSLQMKTTKMLQLAVGMVMPYKNLGEAFTEINLGLGDDGTVETGGLPEDQIAIARDGTTTIYEVKFLPAQFLAPAFA